MAPRSCIECGTEFTPHANLQKTCGPKCRKVRRTAQYRVACRTAKAIASRRLWLQSARGAASLQKSLKRRRELYVPAEPKIKTCVKCGDTFNPHGTDRTCAKPACRKQLRVDKWRRWQAKLPKRQRRRTPAHIKREQDNARQRKWAKTPKGRAIRQTCARWRYWRKQFNGTIPHECAVMLREVWDAGFRLPGAAGENTLRVPAQKVEGESK